MSQKKRKQQPYEISNGALHWKKGPPYIQNVNKVKEPEASKIASKLKYSSSIRQLLCACYLNSGNQEAVGYFKGRVSAMKPIKRNGGISLLFKPVYVSYMRDDGQFIEGKEDHVWIQDNGAFKALGAQKGRCYSFNASVYLYKHPSTDRYEFALENCDNVRLIAESELPDAKKLEQDMWLIMACEYCQKNTHCNRQDCTEKNWRDQMVWGLSHPTKVKKKPNLLPMAEIEKELVTSIGEELKLPELFTINDVADSVTPVIENAQKKTWMVEVREVQNSIKHINDILNNLHM